MTLEEFNKTFPLKRYRLKNSVFSARCFINPSSDETVVLFTGALGISDLLYKQFYFLSKNFSVITFDLQEQYKNNKELCDSAAELLRRMHIKAWVVSQSLGGFTAQILAKTHPEVVKGLILANTGSLYKNMDDDAYKSVLKLLDLNTKLKSFLKAVPFAFYKASAAKYILKYKNDKNTPSQNKNLDDAYNIISSSLTKEMTFHISDILSDTKNYLILKKEDFSCLEDNVLLFINEDDHAFNTSLKESLKELFPNAEIENSLKGGHLSPLINAKEFTDIIKDFINSKSN